MLRRLIFEAQRTWRWLIGKKSEITQLSYKDAFMAHLVLAIMQTSPAPTTAKIPLYTINPIHPVDNRENTVQATREREQAIRRKKKDLLKIGIITKQVMAEIMPSLTYIRIVQSDHERYFCFEGNGRIAALKAVFSPSDDISVEVDLFSPRHPKRILRHISQLRSMHGMAD